jgi:hypothetical protein
LNEYQDDCDVLLDGKETTAKGMDGLENVTTLSLGELESFYTSGGASHSIALMKERGVKNCSYKTLRYKGHCELVKFLIRNKLKKDCLLEIFKIAKPKTAIQDVVIIKVEIEAEDTSWEKELIIPYCRTFSAMQKATAFSISSVAKMMAEKFFDKNTPQHRDYYDLPPKSLTYKHVDYNEFIKNIDFLRMQDSIMDPSYEAYGPIPKTEGPHPIPQPQPQPQTNTTEVDPAQPAPAAPPTSVAVTPPPVTIPRPPEAEAS